jgi:hypothetical protein
MGLQAEFVGTVNASRDNGGKAMLARARLDYRLSDRAVAFTSVETYHQPENDFVRVPLSRNRFSVGLDFSIASEADRRTDPRNEDERYVSLTDRARRRVQE